MIGVKRHSGQSAEICMSEILSRWSVGAPDGVHCVVLYDGREDIKRYKGIRYVSVPRLFPNKIGDIIMTHMIVPCIVLYMGAWVIFSPTPSFPILCGKKNVVMIHDIAYRRYKDEGSFFVRWYMRCMYWCAVHCARKIITVSEFSKKELIDLYHADARKVVTIHNGPVALTDVSEELQQSVLKQYHITVPYFLYIGATRPRKNILCMLEAFALFRKKHNNMLFVLGGAIDTRFINVRREIQRLGLEGKVIQTGFLTNEEKSALYRGASAVLFASLYEGFGLPVLEAQSVGIPLITSNVSSLPEIADNGALFVDPYSVDSIADAMRRVVDDDAVRKEIIQKGYQNIKRFSWERAAQQLTDIFFP